MEDSRITFVVDDEFEGMKITAFLHEVKKISSRMMRSSGKEGRISVNDSNVNLKYKVKSGDIIKIDVVKEESQNIEPEKMDINVVYEDTDIIVVNKQPGIVVHPTKSHVNGTLANGLLYYFMEKQENCIVRLVSRLDRDTSGLIIIAKNQFAHMSLARDMNCESFEKNYIAIVRGNLAEKTGVIDEPIFRPATESIKRAVDSRGQTSITKYEVMESYSKGDVVKLKLETGRTHQIRVHLTNLGHPLFGDSLYSENDDSEYINRQALHACRLAFPHPRTGEILELQADLPDDMKNLIQILKKITNFK